MPKKPKKPKKNDERGINFDQVINIDWDLATVIVDERIEYGETRYIAVAPLNSRIHVVCFTRIDDGLRVISFRKANKREVRHYEQQ